MVTVEVMGMYRTYARVVSDSYEAQRSKDNLLEGTSFKNRNDGVQIINMKPQLIVARNHLLLIM